MSGQGSSGTHPKGRLFSLRPKALEWVDVEDEIVVLDSERSLYLSPNSSGAELWRMLTKGATQQELVAHLVETFEITVDRAEPDVVVFLERLDELGLLEGPDA